MANIKLHLMLGQGLLQNAGNTQAYLLESGDPDLLWPWPNPGETALNTRVFVYDHGNNQLGDGNPVEPWYRTTLSNLFADGAIDPNAGTWAHDLTFLRDVARREVDDWHCLVKLTGNGVLRAPGASSVPGRWDKAAGGLYADIVPAITQAKALLEGLAAGPHTVEVGSITTCFGYQEAANAGVEPSLANNLKADWEQFLTDVRADVGGVIGGSSTSSAPAILYRLHSGTRVFTGGGYPDLGVQVVQNAVSALATSVPNAVVLNVDSTDLRSDNVFQTAPATVVIGELAADAYFRIVDPPVYTGARGAIPVIAYVGQSNVVGQSPAELLTGFFNADGNLQPFDGNGNPEAYEDVWTMDHTQSKVVPFNPYENSNTLPNGTWANQGKFGPDVSLIAELRKLLGGELLLFKVGVGSASLGPNTTDNPVFLKPYGALVYGSGGLSGQPRGVWPTIEQSWEAMRSSCLEVTGKLPDPRLLIVHQGESDTEQALRVAYEDNLRTFLADLRDLVGADTSPGSVVPAGIVRTRKVAGGAFDNEGTDLVRAAQDLVAAEAGNFLVDADDMPYRTDKVHLSAEGTIRLGRRIVASLPESFNTACSTGG